MTFIRKSALRPAGTSPGAAAPKEPNVTIVAADDVLVWPMRDAGGVKVLGNIVLKTGARMSQFYQTNTKAKASYDPEGDGDSITVKHKFETEAPGDGLELNEFVAEWLGVDAIVIFGSCADDFRKMVGTKCAPVRLKPSSMDDNDGRKKTFVFEQEAKTKLLPGHYTGDLALAAPYAAASGTFAITVANGNQYQLPSLAITDAIEPSSMTLADGQIVTFIGGGGVAPATLTQGTAGEVEVLLKAGTTWTGLLNAVIHLQVFNAGDDKYLIELSRS